MEAAIFFILYMVADILMQSYFWMYTQMILQASQQLSLYISWEQEKTDLDIVNMEMEYSEKQAKFQTIIWVIFCLIDAVVAVSAVPFLDQDNLFRQLLIADTCLFSFLALNIIVLATYAVYTLTKSMSRIDQSVIKPKNTHAFLQLILIYAYNFVWIARKSIQII